MLFTENGLAEGLVMSWKQELRKNLALLQDRNLSIALTTDDAAWVEAYATEAQFDLMAEQDRRGRVESGAALINGWLTGREPANLLGAVSDIRFLLCRAVHDAISDERWMVNHGDVDADAHVISVRRALIRSLQQGVRDFLGSAERYLLVGWKEWGLME